MAEFSAFGIAGARVDRIAEAAGCNKNLIYVYFDNKETLFVTVLRNNFERFYDKLPVVAEDLPSYAADLFDFAMANSDLMRLLAWANLERRASVHEERMASINHKLSILEKAEQAGAISGAFPAKALLTLILTIAAAWSEANPFGHLVPPAARDSHAILRQMVMSAIRLLIAAPATP